MVLGGKLANNCFHQKQFNNILLKLDNLTKTMETLVDINKSCEDSRTRMCENTEPLILHHKTVDSKIKLNVDGAVFHCSRRELSRYPDSRLGKLSESSSSSDILQLCDGYTASNNEFFFSKRNTNFPDILEFYRTGSLHISSDHCVIAFSQDLEYWGISCSHLEPCCANKLADAKDMMEKDHDYLETTLTQVDQFPDGSKGRMQKMIWNLFENPYYSNLAAAISTVSVTSILLSIITLILNTFPQFQETEEKDKILGDYYTFAIIEAVCISWFGFEFLVRLISCPNKVVFLKQFMNWIDILVIVPYVVIVVSHSMLPDKDEHTIEEVSNVAQVLRLLRIMKPLRFMARIFKLARHSTGMVALGHTFKSKYKELSLVLLFLGMGTIIFASMAFIAEVEYKMADHVEIKEITTMLDAYWWAVITMTTVGYGDIAPKTRIGKGIGTICAIFGVLVVTLPIPIIGNSFDTFYSQEKRRVKILSRNAQDKSNSCKLERDLVEDQSSYSSAVSSDFGGYKNIFYSDSVRKAIN